MAFTYFFRDAQVLETIATAVAPVLRGYRYVRIWDAGCAHGPEPYSLAIMLRENMSGFAFRNVNICATDIDATGQFGRIIAAGVYPEEEVRRVPEELKRKYFRSAGRPGYLQVCDEIRRRVSFRQHDLLTLVPPAAGFQIVLCKNVLLHFTPEQRVAVVRMFWESLADGGYLVLEKTQELPEETYGEFRRAECNGQVFRKVAAACALAA